MGTEKRERQRAARLDKISAQATAAKREKTRGTAVRIAVAAVVVVAVLFGVSQLMADDSDSNDSGETETAGSESTELPTETTTPEFTDPDLAEQVLARQPPVPQPPPADTPATALETTTLIEGEGEGAAAGDVVTVHYVGVLADGTEFDQSWSRGEPFPVTLGQGSVIVGWDQGLVGAKIGERRHLLIGSDNAYGATGQGEIPPNAPLAFDVDVVDIQTPG